LWHPPILLAPQATPGKHLENLIARAVSANWERNADLQPEARA